MKEVRRVHLVSQGYRDISLEQAMRELARSDTREERGRVLTSLCSQQILETLTHRYELLREEAC